MAHTVSSAHQTPNPKASHQLAALTPLRATPVTRLGSKIVPMSSLSKFCGGIECDRGAWGEGDPTSKSQRTLTVDGHVTRCEPACDAYLEYRTKYQLPNEHSVPQALSNRQPRYDGHRTHTQCRAGPQRSGFHDEP